MDQNTSHGLKAILALWAAALLCIGCSDSLLGSQDKSIPESRVDLAPYPSVTTLVNREPITIRNGQSQEVTFNVPDDAISLSAVIEGPNSTYLVVRSWQDGQGKMLVDPSWLDSDEGAPLLCLSCNNRVTGIPGTATGLAPNNPNGEFSAGTHTISVHSFLISLGFALPANNTPAFLSVHAKRAPELPERGVIDINLHFTGAQGWSAQGAQDNAELQAVLNDVRALYAQVGIEIGTVTYNDVSAVFQVIENVAQNTGDLQELFLQPPETTPNAVNIFFVDELVALSSGGPAFGLILGVAGGIPGPPVTQGSSRSGVAIALAAHKNPDLPASITLANTIGHEVGHFLGLFHTSEQDLGTGPAIHDPLPDTPENDDTYLMFNTGQGSALSPWQGRVMRSNPWVRHP